MSLAFASSELLTLLAAAVLLLGVPLFVVAVLAIASGYVRFQAERELEAAAETDDASPPREGGGADASADDRDQEAKSDDGLEER